MRCLQNPAPSCFPSISFGTLVVVVRQYNTIRFIVPLQTNKINRITHNPDAHILYKTQHNHEAFRTPYFTWSFLNKTFRVIFVFSVPHVNSPCNEVPSVDSYFFFLLLISRSMRCTAPPAPALSGPSRSSPQASWPIRRSRQLQPMPPPELHREPSRSRSDRPQHPTCVYIQPSTLVIHLSSV